MKDITEKKIRVMNWGQAPIETSAGVLLPNGGVQELPEKEALKILDYRGLVDAEKYIPTGSANEALRKEIDELKRVNAELASKVESLKPKHQGK